MNVGCMAEQAYRKKETRFTYVQQTPTRYSISVVYCVLYRVMCVIREKPLQNLATVGLVWALVAFVLDV